MRSPKSIQLSDPPSKFVSPRKEKKNVVSPTSIAFENNMFTDQEFQMPDQIAQAKKKSQKSRNLKQMKGGGFPFSPVREMTMDDLNDDDEMPTIASPFKSLKNNNREPSPQTPDSSEMIADFDRSNFNIPITPMKRLSDENEGDSWSEAEQQLSIEESPPQNRNVRFIENGDEDLDQAMDEMKSFDDDKKMSLDEEPTDLQMSEIIQTNNQEIATEKQNDTGKGEGAMKENHKRRRTHNFSPNTHVTTTQYFSSSGSPKYSCVNTNLLDDKSSFPISSPNKRFKGSRFIKNEYIPSSNRMNTSIDDSFGNRSDESFRNAIGEKDSLQPEAEQEADMGERRIPVRINAEEAYHNPFERMIRLKSPNFYLENQQFIEQNNNNSNSKIDKLAAASHSSTSSGISLTECENTLDINGSRIVLEYSRYDEDFKEECDLGTGSFGKVSKCIHRYDGMNYAVKQTTKNFKSQKHVQEALREIQAMAVLGDSPYIVRYYGAWIEDGKLFVQTELCDGGSLTAIRKKRLVEHLMKKHSKELFAQKPQIPQSKIQKWFESKNYSLDNDVSLFSEEELLYIMKCVCNGLEHMHSLGLYHMDIKPDNIFLSSGTGKYKIGDFGLILSLEDLKTGKKEFMEGDSRYLAKELLEGNWKQVSKADIFSLGASIIELALSNSFNMSNSEWRTIREGNFPAKEFQNKKFSSGFIYLLGKMMHMDPSIRPSATEILHAPVLVSQDPNYDELKKRVDSLTETNLDQQKLIEELKRKVFQYENLKAELQQNSATKSGVGIGAF